MYPKCRGTTQGCQCHCILSGPLRCHSAFFSDSFRGYETHRANMRETGADENSSKELSAYRGINVKLRNDGNKNSEGSTIGSGSLEQQSVKRQKTQSQMTVIAKARWTSQQQADLNHDLLRLFSSISHLKVVITTDLSTSSRQVNLISRKRWKF